MDFYKTALEIPTNTTTDLWII